MASAAAAVPTTPIIVHHLNNSRSQRILWLLEELQLPYEIKTYQRGSDMRAPKELFDVNPLGKSPAITDGSRTIIESGAIIEYLLDKYGNGRLKPAAGTDDQLDYTFWLHFAEGTVMPPLVMSLVFSQVVKNSPFFIRPIATAISSSVHKLLIDPDRTRSFAFMESKLEKQPWFAGQEFTGADIMMSFPVEACAMRARHLMGPKTLDFLERCRQRPAYKTALAKGGEYVFAGQEAQNGKL
ncbi:glutathione S-transferase [Phlyctochytrium arcticum]|nr:glutathione S-transferase [Phlyctochytrium arcticum]